MLAAGVVTAAGLYLYTPSATDLEPRVATIATGVGQPVVTPADVPEVMGQAMVAIEDERFYSHHGLDSVGLLRAAWVDVSRLCACEGGATLTQQLADVVYYDRTNHFLRKFPSMVVALRIEARTPKARILSDYLSVAPMGRGVVGARQASCVYFGHDLGSLTLAQAAELAGMPQAPSNYDPRFDPDRTRHRRNVVLLKMAQLGYATDAQARAAMAEPVLSAGPGC